ncbi:MAG TPA: RT0821/Lpp0805 family surface protein [Gammaproteobacteria bacterium]|nr:RT0821/Lpp0805 family surface protein [Gammaproteobacteria bacterium]
MKKILVALMVSALTLSLAACEGTTPTKQQTGTVVGGVLGGVLGSNVGSGKGQTAATIGGALIGGLLGSAVGKSMDDSDEMKAAQVLERNKTHQAASWHNPDTGNDVTVIPTRTYTSTAGQTCREYDTTVKIDGKNQKAHGTACRQSDGTWKIVN